MVYDYPRTLDRAERLQLLKAGDFAAYERALDEYQRRKEDAAEEIIAATKAARACKIWVDDTRTWFYMHPSLYQPGCLQLTHWDNKGPIGHKAIHEALDLAMCLPQQVYHVDYL
jgi:hypothetical protein